MRNRGIVWIRLALIILCILGGLASGLLMDRQQMHSKAQDDLQVVVFRQRVAGYSGCTDTSIMKEDPDANFGDRELVLGSQGEASILIRFDVSSIPSNAQVQGATLSLYACNVGPQPSRPLIAATYPVSRTWEEMQATWNRATNLVSWGLPGCNDTRTDRSPTPTDSRSMFTLGWYHWDVTSAAQRWVQTPASNKGLLVKQTNTEVVGEFDIRHSEFPGAEVRPSLTITYTLAPPTPTSPPLTPVTPVLLPCIYPPTPGATLVNLQQGVGYNGAEDTTFNFDDRETRYANEWFIRVGYRRHYSGLVKFDVSSIPQGSYIICAALSLFAERWSGGPLDIGAYYVKRANVVSEATWTWASALVPWQMGGCNGPDDRSQTPESVVNVHTILTRYEWDLTRVVDGWVNGSLPNHGVSLQQINELDTDTVWFTSSDDLVIANRPVLIIEYVPPSGPVPTRTRTPTPTVTHTPTRTATPGGVTTVILQDGLAKYEGCADTRISAEAPGSNFGSSELKAGDKQRLATLISFDLSSIPSNATIQSAQLSLYGYSREGSGTFGLDVYAVRRPWTEGEATWNRATATLPWGVPGCSSTFSDRAEVRSDGVTVGAVGWYTWSVRDDVQRMVSQPGTNAGWLLRQSAELAGILSMYSSEYEVVSQRPKLVVTYSAP